MAEFIGFVNEKVPKTDEYLYLNAALGFNSTYYSAYLVCLSVSMLTAMLALGPFANNSWNKRKTLAVCGFMWNAAFAAHGLMSSAVALLPLIAVVGIFQGICSALPFTMISLYFQESHRTRAFFLFFVITTLASPITFLLTFFIDAVGWRLTFIILGVIGMVVAILVWFTTPDITDLAVLDDNKKEKENYISMHS